MTLVSSDELMVRRSRGNGWVTVAVIVSTSVFGLLNIATGDFTTRLRTPAVVFFSATLLLALSIAVDVARSGPRSAPLLVIGPDGITVPGAPTVPWSDIAAIRMTRSGRPSTIRGVAFLPRPGHQLPGVRASGRAQSAGAPRRRPPVTAAHWSSFLT